MMHHNHDRTKIVWNSTKTTCVLPLFLIVAACQLMAHRAAAGVDVVSLYRSLLAERILDQVAGSVQGQIWFSQCACQIIYTYIF